MFTPLLSKRAPAYADVPGEKWNDWRWQLSHRLNTVKEIEKVFLLTEFEKKALNSSGLFRVDITPYFISLIDPNDPDDPIPKQVIPTDGEMVPFTSMMEDFLRRTATLPCRAGSSVSGSSPYAGHHAMRLVLQILHTLAHRRRPERHVFAP